MARRVAPRLVGDISQVEPYDGDALVLRLVADNLEVRLPYDQVRKRLSTLREVLGRVYGECPNPAYVDLRFAGQAVVGRRSSAKTTDVTRDGGKADDFPAPARMVGHG